MLIVPMKRNERTLISTDISFSSRIIDRYTRFEQAAFEEASMDFLKLSTPVEEPATVKEGDVYQVLLQTIYYKMQHTIITNQKNYQDLLDRQMVTVLQQLRESFHSREYATATRLYRQLQHTKDQKELLLLYREVQQKIVNRGISKEAPALFYDVINVIRREDSVSQVAKEYRSALEIRQKEMQTDDRRAADRDYHWQQNTLENIISHRSYEENVSLYELLEHENLVLREEVKSKTVEPFEKETLGNVIEEQVLENEKSVREQNTYAQLVNIIRQAPPEKLERIIRVVTGEDRPQAEGFVRSETILRDPVSDNRERSQKTKDRETFPVKRTEHRLPTEVLRFSENIRDRFSETEDIRQRQLPVSEDRKRESVLGAVRSLNKEAAGEIYRYLAEEKLLFVADKSDQSRPMDQTGQQTLPSDHAITVSEDTVVKPHSDSKEELTVFLKNAAPEQIEAVFAHMADVYDRDGRIALHEDQTGSRAGVLANSFVAAQDSKKIITDAADTEQKIQSMTQGRDIRLLMQLHSFSEKVMDNLVGRDGRLESASDLESRNRESVLGALQSLDEESAGQIYAYLTEEKLLYATDRRTENDRGNEDNRIVRNWQDDRDDQAGQGVQAVQQVVLPDSDILSDAAGKSEDNSKEVLTALLKTAAPEQIEAVVERMQTVYAAQAGAESHEAGSVADGMEKTVSLAESVEPAGQEQRPLTQNRDIRLLSEVHSFSEKVLDNLAGMVERSQGNLTDLEDRKRESFLGAVQGLDEEAAGQIYAYLTEENLLYATDRRETAGQDDRKIPDRQGDLSDLQKLQADMEALLSAAGRPHSGSKEALKVLLKAASPEQIEAAYDRMLDVYAGDVAADSAISSTGNRHADHLTAGEAMTKAVAAENASLIGKEGRPLTQNRDIRLLSEVHSFSEKVLGNLAGMAERRQGSQADLEDSKRESFLGAVQNLDEESAGQIYAYLTEENLLYATDRQESAGQEDGKASSGQGDLSDLQKLQADMEALISAAGKPQTGSKEALTVLLKTASPEQIEAVYDRMLDVYAGDVAADSAISSTGNRHADHLTAGEAMTKAAVAGSVNQTGQEGRPLTQNRDIRLLTEVHSFSEKVLGNLAGMAEGSQGNLTDLEDRKRESFLGAVQGLDEGSAGRIYAYLTEENLLYATDGREAAGQEDKDAPAGQGDLKGLQKLQADMEALINAAGKPHTDSKEALTVLLKAASPEQIEAAYDRMLDVYAGDVAADSEISSAGGHNADHLTAGETLTKAVAAENASLTGKEGRPLTQNRDIRLLSEVHSFSEKVLGNLAGMAEGSQRNLTDLEDRKRESFLGAVQGLDEGSAVRIYAYLTEESLLYATDRRDTAGQEDRKEPAGQGELKGLQKLQADMEALLKAAGKPQTGSKEALTVLLKTAASEQIEAAYDRMLDVYDRGVDSIAESYPVDRSEGLTEIAGNRVAAAKRADGKNLAGLKQPFTQNRDIRSLTENRQEQPLQMPDRAWDSKEQQKRLQLVNDIKHFSERVIDHMSSVTIQQGMIGDASQMQRQSVLDVLAEAGGEETENLYQYLVMEELVHHGAETRGEAEQPETKKTHEAQKPMETPKPQYRTALKEQLREWVTHISSEQLNSLSQRIFEIYQMDLSDLFHRLAKREITGAVTEKGTSGSQGLQERQEQQSQLSRKDPQNLQGLQNQQPSGNRILSQAAPQEETGSHSHSFAESDRQVMTETKPEKWLTIREDFEKQITDRHMQDQRRIKEQEENFNPVLSRQMLSEVVSRMTDEESRQIYTALVEQNFVFRQEAGDAARQLQDLIQKTDEKELAALQTVFREQWSLKQDLPAAPKESGIVVPHSAETPKTLRPQTLQTILKDVRVGGNMGMVSRQAEGETAAETVIAPVTREFVPSLVMLREQGADKDEQSKRLGIVNYYLASDGQENAVVREQLLQVVRENMDRQPPVETFKTQEQAFTQFIHTADTVVVEKIFDTMMERSEGFRQMAQKAAENGQSFKRPASVAEEAITDYVAQERKRQAVQVPAYEEAEPLRYRAVEAKESVTEEIQKKVEQNVADYVKIERDKRKVVAKESRETRQIVDKQVQKIKALTRKLEEQEEEIKKLTITSKNNVVDYVKVRDNVMRYLERELRLERMRRGMD